MPASKKKATTAKAAKPTLQDQIEGAIKTLDQVAALVVDKDVPSLTPMERKRSLKLRKGGEKVITTLAALATRYGVSLASHPVSEMTDNAALAQTVTPLLKRSEELHTQLTNTAFRAGSQAWESATVHYTTLRRLAKSNGDLAANLKEVADFFAIPKKAKKDTTAATPSAAPTQGATTEATAPEGGAPATSQTAPAATTASTATVAATPAH